MSNNALNQKLIETIDLAVKENRVANTYIFEGEDETLVLQIVTDFAKKICKAEVDMQFLVQEKENLISVKDVRENICNDVINRPYGDGRKVYIVKNAELMNINAQNALLKTLEEPPTYVTIFLLTKNKNIFLPTILSRAVKYEVVSENEIREDELRMEMKKEVLKFFKESSEGDLTAGRTLLKFVTTNKEMSDDTVNEMRSFLRDVFLYRAQRDRSLIKRTEDVDTIMRFAEKAKLSTLNKFLKDMDQLEDRIKANTNLEMSWQFLLATISDAVR